MVVAVEGVIGWFDDPLSKPALTDGVCKANSLRGGMIGDGGARVGPG